MKTLFRLLLMCAAVVCFATSAAATNGYVACSNSDDVIPFDLVTYATGTPILLPATYPYPYDATMNPDGTEVWVPDASGDHVVVIDMATNTITHTIPVGEYPNSVVFTNDGSTALVSARDGDVVTLIKTSDYSITGTLSVLTGAGGTYDGPGNMALDPTSKNIYAVDWYDATLFEIDEDASTVLRSVEIGVDLWQLVCDPNGVYVYLTDRGPDIVRVIDRVTLTEVTTVPVGTDPWGIDVTEDGSQLVVACEDVGDVYVIDTSDWSTTVLDLEAGVDCRDVDILDADGYAFVAGGDITGTDKVYVVQLSDTSLKDEFFVGGNPNCVAVQPQMTSPDVGIADGTVAGLKVDCHPNPFNPKTVVTYFVPETADVDLSVFDVTGRRVAVLASGQVEGGELTATWDGVSEGGVPVATGVYFVRLEALGASTTAKAVLLK